MKRDLGEDVEDLGNAPKEKEMITRELRSILQKQGYGVVGSHSAVKLCRWSKTHLRGNGACYKHTFYGLNSASCMEATPSLACANRCLFCWRHHSNPTGRSWRWKIDDAKDVYDGMVANQRVESADRFSVETSEAVRGVRRRVAGPCGGSDGAATLRVVAGGRADHVPEDRRIHRSAAPVLASRRE